MPREEFELHILMPPIEGKYTLILRRNNRTQIKCQIDPSDPAEIVKFTESAASVQVPPNRLETMKQQLLQLAAAKVPAKPPVVSMAAQDGPRAASPPCGVSVVGPDDREVIAEVSPTLESEGEKSMSSSELFTDHGEAQMHQNESITPQAGPAPVTENAPAEVEDVAPSNPSPCDITVAPVRTFMGPATAAAVVEQPKSRDHDRKPRNRRRHGDVAEQPALSPGRRRTAGREARKAVHSVTGNSPTEAMGTSVGVIPITSAQLSRTIEKVPLTDITPGPSCRLSFGDLDALGTSMNEDGQIHPIVLNSARVIICGRRRYEAAKAKGWPVIDAIIDPTFDDLVKAMKAEQAENTCRLELSISEKVALADRIKATLEQQAQERKHEGQRKGGKAHHRLLAADSAASCPAPDHQQTTPAGDTRELVAAAVGLSHDTLAKAAKVVAKGTPELVAAMDRGTLSVTAAAAAASLPSDEQHEVAAGGKKVRAANTSRTGRRPRWSVVNRMLDGLDALAGLPPSESTMAALREGLADLRHTLKALLT